MMKHDDFDDDDFFDDYEQNEEYLKAIDKNNCLIDDLERARDEFCGIGTRKVKLRLNKLAKDNVDALYVRKLLEIEDVNIQAKRCESWKYREKTYDRKQRMLYELMAFCESHPEYRYGVQGSDNYSVNGVVYFELLDGTQLSFHCMIYDFRQHRRYDGRWDGLVNSTLPKLEKYILEHFSQVCEVG